MHYDIFVKINFWCSPLMFELVINALGMTLLNLTVGDRKRHIPLVHMRDVNLTFHAKGFDLLSATHSA